MSLYNALSGGLPAQVQQQATPSPSPSGDLGGGSIFQALAQSPMQHAGAQPAQMGAQVADNTGLMQGNPFYNPDQPQAPEAAQPINYQPEPEAPSSDSSLAKTATDFFNRIKK